MINQKNLFRQWQDLIQLVKVLGSYVQNDFNKLIADGMTKEEVQKLLNRFEEDIPDGMEGLMRLSNMTCLFLERVIGSFDKEKL